MTEPEFDDDLADVADVADYIVGNFAAENDGVAKVIPSTEIQVHLDEVVENADEFDQAEWDDFVIDVKDAVLEQDVIISPALN